MLEMIARNTKILVAVPYHEKKRYCLHELYNSLREISSACKEDGGIDLEIVVRHDLNPFGQKDNVKIQREFFRRLALDGNFDYLFFHGADTVPPRKVLRTLLNHREPVVSGVYFQRGEKKAVNAIAWIEGMAVEDKNELLSQGNPDYPASRLITVSGHGLDCCLISCGILSKISFMDWDVNDDDYPFCDRVKALGYQLFVDRTVQCFHYESDNTFSLKGECHRGYNPE